jgi:hypothetical protein
MKTRFLVSALALIFVFGVACVVIFGFLCTDPEYRAVNLEVTKSALSGCVVAVIGAVIALLLKEREQSVQRQQLRVELLAQFLRQFTETYLAAKRIRRRLRSIGLSSKYRSLPRELDGDKLDFYTKEMSSLDEAQSTLEALAVQAEKLPPLAEIPDVAKGLRYMEDYLREVVKESEKERAAAGVAPIPINKLARLQEFTASRNAQYALPGGTDLECRFKSHFSGAREGILMAIQPHL